MKSNLFMKRKLEIGLTLLIGMSAFWGCNNDLAPIRQNQALPPDLSKHSVFESFSPDSGGIGTQLIIRGKNFGSDPSYVKVTVNNKEAAIVGMDDEVIYAIVPARADTGYVRLFIGKDENIEEYASETKFRYQFKRNVTTMVGQHGMKGREDGSYAASKLQRTWFLLTDKDGSVVRHRMVLCAVHVMVKWKLWCSAPAVRFSHLPVWHSVRLRTLFISLSIPIRMRVIPRLTSILFM